MFEIVESFQNAQELAQILVHSCELVLKAVEQLPELKKSPNILDCCLQIDKLDHEADNFYRHSLVALFRKGNVPLLVMKWREIFDSLESAIDCCSAVSNVIEGVVLEYS